MGENAPISSLCVITQYDWLHLAASAFALTTLFRATVKQCKPETILNICQQQWLGLLGTFLNVERVHRRSTRRRALSRLATPPSQWQGCFSRPCTSIVQCSAETAILLFVPHFCPRHLAYVTQVAKYVVSSLPLLLVGYICGSRTRNYFHNYDDVGMCLDSALSICPDGDIFHEYAPLRQSDSRACTP